MKKLGSKTNKKGKDVKTKPIKNQNQSIEKFKRQYFDFYDDVKDYTKGKEDW